MRHKIALTYNMHGYIIIGYPDTCPVLEYCIGDGGSRYHTCTEFIIDSEERCFDCVTTTEDVICAIELFYTHVKNKEYI